MSQQNHAWSSNKILTHLPAARQLYKAQNDPLIPFPPPRFISIWISQICNLDCTYCYFSDSNHNPEKTFIKTDEILAWLQEMKNFGAEALEYSGGGEPTVHKDFAKIVEASSNMGYVLGLITHACNPMPLELLASRMKYVRCGLDAATQETHTKIKRKEGKFGKAIENIKELVRLRDKHEKERELKGEWPVFPNFTVGIKIVLNSINEHEVFDMVRMARNLDVDYIQLKYEHSSDHPISAERFNELRGLFKIYELENEHTWQRTRILGNVDHQKATTQCFMSPIHTVVDSMGQLLQCCFFDKYPIGTIRQPIREVWGGEQHRAAMAKSSVKECGNLDCRFNYFNTKMKSIIEDPLAGVSFI